jgi:hypothetical protein
MATQICDKFTHLLARSKPCVVPGAGLVVLGLPIAQTEFTELRCSIFQHPIHFSPIRKIEALESFENVRAPNQS